MKFDLSKVALGDVYHYGETDLLVLSIEKVSEFEVFKPIMQDGIFDGSPHVVLKDEVIDSFLVTTKDGKMYHLKNDFEWLPIQMGLWERVYVDTKQSCVVGHTFISYWWNKMKDEFPMTKAEFLAFFDPETSKEIAKLI